MNSLRSLTCALAIALAAAPALAGQSDNFEVRDRGQVAVNQNPRVEVAFLLDTTGSMSGLIQGAKVKIWSIAKEMLDAQVTPDLRMALIGYRDRGDAYVTRTFDLTGDIDRIYGELLKFEARGGGDRPESVNQALDDAINGLSWNNDPQVYRVVFLVGDSPPQMQYHDDIKFPETARLAQRKDVVINTLLAGGAQDTGRIWREIARLAHGRYSEIPQDGGMQIIETPYDQDIQQLTYRLNRTALPYGSSRSREEVESKLDRAAAAPASTTADKQAYHRQKGAAAELVTGAGELINDLAEGRVALENLEPTSLPKELQGKSLAAQREVIARRGRERSDLRGKLDGLLEQREAYLEIAREKSAGGGDAFDREVGAIIREQGSAKGIVY